jgi:hypothetical protein
VLGDPDFNFKPVIGPTSALIYRDLNSKQGIKKIPPVKRNKTDKTAGHQKTKENKTQTQTPTPESTTPASYFVHPDHQLPAQNSSRRSFAHLKTLNHDHSGL